MGNSGSPERPVASVALIGCGRIGSEWDEGRRADQPALTHAAAFQRAARASLVALCDADSRRLLAAGRARGVSRQYTSTEALFSELVPDIAVIATPTAVREEPLERALSAGVQTIVCEKPLAVSYQEGRRLAARLADSGAQVLVNYLRRWDVAMRTWRDRIARGELGTVTRAVGWYGKGLVNNGTHLIDLVLFLTGAQPVEARFLAQRLDREEAAWSNGADRAVDAEIAFAGRHPFILTLIGTDHRNATLFELDLLGTGGRLRISDAGRTLEAWASESDSTTPGYRILRPVPAEEPRLMYAMEKLAEEAVALALEEPVAPACGPGDALRPLAAIDAIHRSQADQGTWQKIES